MESKYENMMQIGQQNGYKVGVLTHSTHTISYMKSRLYMQVPKLIRQLDKAIEQSTQPSKQDSKAHSQACQVES